MEPVVTTNPRMPLNQDSPDSAAPVPVARNNAIPSSASRSPDSQTAKGPGPRPYRWLNHIAVMLFAAFCVVLGVLLVLLPWTLQWTSNPLLWTHSGLRTFLGYGFVRGVCSGLGLLDLWIGIREVSHYFERSDRFS